MMGGGGDQDKMYVLRKNDKVSEKTKMSLIDYEKKT